MSGPYFVKRRHVIAGMAALAAGTALPGSAVMAQATPKPGGTLRMSHSTRIATLNTLNLSGPAEYPCSDMIHCSLTRVDGENRPVPYLAESWSANDDGSEFTFTLRPGITFHDGTPCTSADVVATYKAILNPDIAAAARSVLDMIDTVEAVDDLNVKFTLSSPYADFPIATAHRNAKILSVAALNAPLTELDTSANGTGPFKIETFDSARMVRLVKNEDFFLPGQPYLDAVEMVLFPDLAAETINFLSGDIDVMQTVQQADFQRLSDADGVATRRQPGGVFVNLVMRYDTKPWDDVRVRRAMALAFDRQMLVDLVIEGLGRPAYDNIIAPEYGFAIDAPEKTYDPEAAKALLTEAGYPDGIQVKLVASNRPAIRSQVAIAIQQMAGPAGFDIEVETMPHDTYLSEIWMKGPFYIGYWGNQTTVDGTLTMLLTSDASYEDSAWKNAEFDSLVAEARATTDDTKRAELYASAQELMLRDLPYIVPFFQDTLIANRDDVDAWNEYPRSGSLYIENVWLDRA